MTTALPAAFAATLHALLGDDGWRTDDSALQAHAQDNSWRHALPAGVAFPRDRDQVVALVRACRVHGIALVARGAGTGTTGAAVPVNGSIVLSFARMNRILDIQPGNRCAVVEPGVLNGDLQHALVPHGLFWAPDPSSADICSIG
uniref:FAD-binding oxidoreductase n=1 Tax=Stenotrophomonas sp. TaxID=69392 RepID=UPI00289E4935